MNYINYFLWSLLSFCPVDCQPQHPDTYLSIIELIQKYGYPVEVHQVTTEDGYILTMYRIPYGRNNFYINRKPILLMHGLGGQAENYIVNGLNNASLAYSLANNDYDVWIGNARGSQHSRKHRVLNPSQKKFWDFSFHEIGLYDLPAKIDYILEVTNKPKLHYIGHSQGGTVLYVMASLRPEYQNKIVLASLLAPGGYENHFSNTFILPFVKVHQELSKLADVLNLFELPPSQANIYGITVNICSKLLRICELFYQLFIGNIEEINTEMLPMLIRFFSTVSLKQLLHYAQVIDSGHFRPWNFGPRKNIDIYGLSYPPDYPVERITMPIAMYYSIGDNIVFFEDVENICNALGNCVRKFILPNKKWNHADFMISKNLVKELINPLIEFADNYVI